MPQGRNTSAASSKIAESPANTPIYTGRFNSALANVSLGTLVALAILAVNWLIESVRWTWLTVTFLMFIAAECAATISVYQRFSK